jgi:hypothetical protein
MVLNVYQKLQLCRCELQKMCLKKSGQLLSNIDIKRTGNVYVEQIEYEINKYREVKK